MCGCIRSWAVQNHLACFCSRCCECVQNFLLGTLPMDAIACMRVHMCTMYCSHVWGPQNSSPQRPNCCGNTNSIGSNYK